MKTKKSLFFICIFLLSTKNIFALESLWYYTETPRSRESYFKNSSKINILGPQTYFLKMDGVIVGEVKADVLERAQKNKTKIMPLLANITGKTFDRKTVNNLLENPENWEKVSKYLREEAYKKGYYGWQLDLENIDVKYKQSLNDMVKYLKSEFEKDNLKLSIAVVSKISDTEKDYQIYEKLQPNYYKYWAGVYDYKTLGENVDFVSVMIYDEPNSPGPVATLGWSKKVIDFTLKNIAQEKISFGIPTYGWAYKKDQKKMFSMVDYGFTKAKLENFDKRSLANMTTGAGESKIFGNISWVSYNSGGKNYTVWYENKKSFQTKLDQIKTLAPKSMGISMWVLGDEDPKVWEIFK